MANQIVFKCKTTTVSILGMHYLYTFIYTTRLLVYVLACHLGLDGLHSLSFSHI